MDVRVPRRERERLRHRQEILEAARKVVAQRGIDGLTVEQVAREADFAVGSIYRHFRSKEELIEVVLGELMEPLFEHIEALPGSGAPFAEQLRELIGVVHAQRVEDFPLLQAMLWVPGAFPAIEGGSRLHAAMVRFGAAVDAVVAVGQAEGVLEAGPRAPMVIALTGMMESFSKAEIFGFTPPGADSTNTICRAFLRGFGQGTR